MEYNINHLSYTYKSYLFLPIGAYYNREYFRIKAGDVIVFSDGEKAEVTYAGLRSLTDTYTRFQMKETYKSRYEIIIRRWENNAIMQGHNRDVISKEKCLIIHYKFISRNHVAIDA